MSSTLSTSEWLADLERTVRTRHTTQLQYTEEQDTAIRLALHKRWPLGSFTREFKKRYGFGSRTSLQLRMNQLAKETV